MSMDHRKYLTKLKEKRVPATVHDLVICWPKFHNCAFINILSKGFSLNLKIRLIFLRMKVWLLE